MPQNIQITKKECDSPREIIGKLKNGKTYKIKIIMKEKDVYILEIEDALFRHNSAVFLPKRELVEEEGTDSQEKVNGLVVLCDVLRWAYNNKNYKMLLAGHTDTSGPDDYNFKLSKSRADSVYFLLVAQKDSWVEVVKTYNKIEDKQQILKWAALTYSWQCDPGKIDGIEGPDTQTATRNFQKRSGISDDGIFGEQTWGVVYELYQKHISQLMENDDGSKNALANRSSLNWAYSDPHSVGCGELWPLAHVGRDEMKSQVNRRVEVLFFNESMVPKCKCTGGICLKDDCLIYPSGLFSRKYINQQNQPPVQTECIYHIHIDADRDGIIDDDWSENEQWEFGEGKKGAILRYNNDNDDDDSAKKMDFENSVIDQNEDLNDIAQLELRKEIQGKTFPSGWQLVLEVSDKTKIRIFDTCDSSGKEIIGPTKGRKHIFNDPNQDVYQLGMEALAYPGIDFDPPEIELLITVNDDNGGVKHQERAILRSAPWIMFNHLNTTEEVYVVHTSDNAAFRTELTEAIGSVPLKVAPLNPYGDDRWMQDVMEIGFSSLPSLQSEDVWSLPAAMRTYNDRKKGGWGLLDKYPKDELLGPDYAFHQTSKPGIGTSLDSFGNLECSPPVTVNGKEYKFGRIVYGEGSGSNRMHQSVTDFLHAQLIQKPFSIDTGWLAVGHVDEIFSFCPMKDTLKQFRVLAASPKVALDIIRDLESSGYGDAKLFQGVRDAAYSGGKMQPMNVYKFQTASEILADSDFNIHQDLVQSIIDEQKEVLKTELGLTDSDFLDLPVLFREDNGNGYIAYTAGVVNMLVVTHPGGARLCIPKPFGPVAGGNCQFESDIMLKLGPSGSSTTGLEYTFIDDFITYHNLYGEIHCGTNSKRVAPANVWWWEQEV
ncbi:MAG: peptidoglycan-binding protein [Chitinispirillaceae bacterium]|nr:peptidoglycan-binding protein [Chitinispirillaceae bacterium]